MPRLPAVLAALLLVLPLAACRREAPPASPSDPTTDAPVVPAPPAPDTGASPRPEAPDAGEGAPGGTVPVDLAGGRIGGVDLDGPADTIVRQLGDEGVREEQTAVEGEPRTVYVFTIGGAEVRKSAYVVSYRDARFRTAEGLGPGVPISAFGDRYGHAEIAPGEEGQCRGAWYRVEGRRVRACVPDACTAGSCRVTGVIFVAEAAG